MGIQTIEDDFEHQAVEIIQNIVNDFKEDDETLKGENLDDWLWENSEELGKYFYEKVNEYFGIERIIEKIKF